MSFKKMSLKKCLIAKKALPELLIIKFRKGFFALRCVKYICFYYRYIVIVLYYKQIIIII